MFFFKMYNNNFDFFKLYVYIYFGVRLFDLENFGKFIICFLQKWYYDFIFIF